MKQIYEITSIEQAKVLSHDLRMNVIKLFRDGVQRTAKQIADYLEMPPSKVHYHVKELVRVGLLELIETKENKGIIEKYYLPVAEKFEINISGNDDKQKEFEDGRIELLKNTLEKFKLGYQKTMNEKKSSLSFMYIDLTEEERLELKSDMERILKKYEGREDQSDDVERQSYGLIMGMYKEEDE